MVALTKLLPWAASYLLGLYFLFPFPFKRFSFVYNFRTHYSTAFYYTVLSTHICREMTYISVKYGNFEVAINISLTFLVIVTDLGAAPVGPLKSTI